MNRVGRHEFLCQRYSSLYGMMAWGLRDKIYPIYDDVYRALRDNLIWMKLQPGNTDSINKLLEQADRELRRMRITAEASKDTFVPGLIDHSVTRMIDIGDQLRIEYVQLAEKLDGVN